MGFWAVTIYILIALVSVLLLFLKNHFSYWKRRGIPHDEPHLFAGNIKELDKTKHFRNILKECYDKYKGSGPFAGFYLFLNRSVVVLDLDLIKNILIKDFNNFADRGLFNNDRDDPLTGHLFALDGVKWKKLRNKLSPTFTSGKMKLMFPTVISVSDELINVLDEASRKDPVVEIKDIVARFTTDVIGTCAFGIDCNSLKNPNAEFRIMGGQAFTKHRHNQLIEGMIFSFPELARKLRMRTIHDDIHNFFLRVVRTTVNFREKNSIKRDDFMNLLLELKNSEDGITIEEMAAQTFVFFLGGFETSSTTMGFALYELALNQDIQEKMRIEINEVTAQHGDKFTYECMSEMPYMEMVIKETLRKYSVLVNLIRKASNEYRTSDPKYIIPKGSYVIIPSDAIHRDPEIYPDPEKFDPERFTAEEIQKRHPITWLPFGDGPRNCIGSRFGKMQTYVGLSMLLKHFRFSYSLKTPIPLEMDIKNQLLAAKGGIYLKVERV